jgi:hypothetical protein
MRVRTMTQRGLLSPGASHRLVMDDGKFTNGFKVKAFYIWSPTWDNQCSAILSYSETAPPFASAADGNQIGWANYNDSTTNATDVQGFIDPDHIVQQDLYIHTQGAQLSYLVILEPRVLSEPEGVLQMIKASSQDEP